MNIGPIEREHAEALYEAAIHHDNVKLAAVVDAISSSWTRDSKGVPAKVGDIFSMGEPCDSDSHFIIARIDGDGVSACQIDTRKTDLFFVEGFTRSAIIKRLVPAGGGE